jgi:adenylosuccinate synthase
MSGIVVLGAQWGDEGKGKIVDTLAKNADYIVRFQGGCNAGHTLVVDGEKTVLHQIPSGILNKETINVIGQGCVVDLTVLLNEIEKLDIPMSEMQKRLRISGNAAIIPEYNVKIDQFRERKRQSNKIGTTGKGIGPTYEDIVARKAIRINDLFDKETLLLKLNEISDEKNAILKHLSPRSAPYHFFPMIMANKLYDLGQKIKPFVSDTGYLLRKALKQGENVVFEGAQGALLDVYHGTYPYVTSSQTGVSGALHGTGVPIGSFDRIIGVVKAYQTRVGSGPFPTELNDETGEFLREKGQEYGATTGRSRRCGWLDLPALKYSAEINGFSEFVLTKLDILSDLDNIKVCVDYTYDADVFFDSLERRVFQPENAEPHYMNFPGWKTDISQVRKFEDLPVEAQNYINFIEKYTEIPVKFIGVGPGRSEIITL